MHVFSIYYLDLRIHCFINVIKYNFVFHICFVYNDVIESMQAEIMKQYNSDVKPVLQEFSQDTLGVEAGVAAAITADQYSTLPPPLQPGD